MNPALTESNMRTDTILEGNCVAVLRDFPADSIDLTVTSPPYDGLRDYAGYEFDAASVGQALLRVMKPGGVVVWVVGDRINGGRSMTSFRQAIMFQDIGFTVHDVMVYQKKNTPFMRSNAYTNCWELMLVLTKGGAPRVFNPLKDPTVRNGPEMLTHNKRPDGINKKKLATLNPEKTRTNIWAYAVGYGGTTRDKAAFEHPAMFPEKLAADHILSWSNPGDVVLDPMCGAGTTCKMAKLHGRRYIGIDICDRYVEIARKRVASVAMRQMDLSMPMVA